MRNYQGNAVFNYTEAKVPHTRIYEHKHFDLSLKTDHTLVTHEYPTNWEPGMIEYYPVRTTQHNEALHAYEKLRNETQLPITFGGRLAEFRYYDMHQVVGAALKKSEDLLTC